MKKILSLIFLTFITAVLVAAPKKERKTEKPEGYKFTVTKEVAVTSVKDQSRSGTCWSFSANSFLENELLRMGKGECDLSEMWIVRHTYFDKAVKYVRMHGEINFAAGGSFIDVFNVIRNYGIVPEGVYYGLGYGLDKHDHAELDAILEGYVKAVAANKGKILTTAWIDGLNGILDAYFGKLPETFTVDGVEYTPDIYAKSLGLNMDDYVSITTYTHHPFYTRFILEIPDNWAWESCVNVPIDEFMPIFDHAIDNGYSVLWGADVSEKGFKYKEGFAVIPELDMDGMDRTEQARWVKLAAKEKDDELYKLEKPGKEKQITQQNRQKAFDNYETTDDHGMVITGMANDQNGTKYYKVKNSWGTAQLYDGYFYASYPYVAYKTMNIVVHKDAIPVSLRGKIGL